MVTESSRQAPPMYFNPDLPKTEELTSLVAETALQRCC